MATKKSTAKPISRTGNKNTPQLTQFKFRWWMALVLVAVVAIIGIVIVRFSHAAVTYNQGRVNGIIDDQDCLYSQGRFYQRGHYEVNCQKSYDNTRYK